jgi:hypothetical protein
MKKITWESGNILIPSTIKSVENQLLVEFPQSYKDIILENNASTPSIFVFDTAKTVGRCFGNLLSFKPEENNIVEVFMNLKQDLPENIIPFADDPSGNYLCFDFRKSKNPEIVFWNHELTYEVIDNQIRIPNRPLYELHTIEFVADNFQLFLTKLYSTQPYNDDLGDLSQYKITY